MPCPKPEALTPENCAKVVKCLNPNPVHHLNLTVLSVLLFQNQHLVQDLLHPLVPKPVCPTCPTPKEGKCPSPERCPPAHECPKSYNIKYIKVPVVKSDPYLNLIETLFSPKIHLLQSY